MLAHAPPRGGSRQLGPPHPGASRPTLGRLTPAWTVPTLGLTVRPGGCPRGGSLGLPWRSHEHQQDWQRDIAGTSMYKLSEMSTATHKVTHAIRGVLLSTSGSAGDRAKLNVAGVSASLTPVAHAALTRLTLSAGGGPEW